MRFSFHVILILARNNTTFAVFSAPVVVTQLPPIHPVSLSYRQQAPEPKFFTNLVLFLKVISINNRLRVFRKVFEHKQEFKLKVYEFYKTRMLSKCAGFYLLLSINNLVWLLFDEKLCKILIVLV